jgi:NADH-quinone oxidoreductase subunit I
VITALAQGFLMTLKHLFRRPVTIQYPEERREPAARFRGLHALRCLPGTTQERCISCCLCARICPTQCIRLVTSGEEKKVIDVYEVDLGHCLFCGLCAEVCPVEAIVLSRRYEASYYSRGETVLGKPDLLRNGEGL